MQRDLSAPRRAHCLEFPCQPERRDGQLRPASAVALHQDTYCIATLIGWQHTRGRSSSAFETVANHARAATRVSLGNGTALRGVERGKYVFGFYMKAIEVIQPAVPCLRHNRQGPRLRQSSVTQTPHNHGIAHRADAVSIGDGHGALEKSRLFDPACSGHLAVAVETEPARVNRIGALRVAWQNDGDSCADRSFANFQRTFAANESRRSYFHSGDIGDGIQRPRSSIKGDTKAARSNRTS